MIWWAFVSLCYQEAPQLLSSLSHEPLPIQLHDIQKNQYIFQLQPLKTVTKKCQWIHGYPLHERPFHIIDTPMKFQRESQALPYKDKEAFMAAILVYNGQVDVLKATCWRTVQSRTLWLRHALQDPLECHQNKTKTFRSGIVFIVGTKSHQKQQSVFLQRAVRNISRTQDEGRHDLLFKIVFPGIFSYICLFQI